MTEIILKQGTGEPDADKVNVAEVAIDTGTGDLYTKLADGSVKHLNPEYDSGDESLWEQSGDDIYYSAGRVGIGGEAGYASKIIQSLGGMQRAIGGGDARLQVAGAGYFTGDIYGSSVSSEGGVFYAGSGAGYLSVSGANRVKFTSNDFTPATVGGLNCGSIALPFYQGNFSADVNVGGTIYGNVDDVPSHVKAITPTQIANWDAGTGGGGGGATTDGRISDTQITNWDQAYGWGNHASAGYQPAGSYAASNHTHSEYEAAGTAYTKAESDAKYELKGAGGGGGLPDGDWACSGSITATGNITAYYSSDERLKDDIKEMPAGFIDSIEPVTWKWKEGGKDSGGVVAQQLQACGLERWVNEAPNGDLGVDYNALIGMLIAEVKSLKAEVEALKS